MTGAIIGFSLSAGLWAIWTGWFRSRRPSLEQRVAPYVRDVRPQAQRSNRAWSAVFGPSIKRAAQTIGEWVGSSASVRTRLERLGSTSTVEEFRLKQLGWGLAGFGVLVGIGLLLWSTQRTPAPVLLALSAFGFVAGITVCDQRLGAQVARREADMESELPVIAEMLALAVAVGESPQVGLERIVGRTSGALSDELRRVLAEISTGTAMSSAFDDLSRRTGVEGVARFADGLAVAIDRGTPLVDVLHAQAADVRDAARRRLMEIGGRKEVAMMLPVVFILLPVTVIFAFYPGLVGLQLNS